MPKALGVTKNSPKNHVFSYKGQIFYGYGFYIFSYLGVAIRTGLYLALIVVGFFVVIRLLDALHEHVTIIYLIG